MCSSPRARTSSHVTLSLLPLHSPFSSLLHSLSLSLRPLSIHLLRLISLLSVRFCRRTVTRSVYTWKTRSRHFAQSEHEQNRRNR
uniref:Putative secreted peptide n=1 Tax=Anopheles braziliensis TaxID=58242 RepID=A0A2M3ZRV6_9DIPT